MKTKVEKEFKEEVDQELANGIYVMKKVIVKGGIIILLLGAISGVCGIVYTKTIGKEQTNAEREVFKETTTYTESAASFLSKEYNEYSKAESNADKKTICQYVIMRYPNLDTETIDNDTLKRFYEVCMTY